MEHRRRNCLSDMSPENLLTGTCLCAYRGKAYFWEKGVPWRFHTSVLMNYPGDFLYWFSRSGDFTKHCKACLSAKAATSTGKRQALNAHFKCYTRRSLEYGSKEGRRTFQSPHSPLQRQKNPQNWGATPAEFSCQCLTEWGMKTHKIKVNTPVQKVLAWWLKPALQVQTVT